MKYRARLDWVIIRVELCTYSKGEIAMPESSDLSKRWYVESAGPDVRDLKPGDQVILTIDPVVGKCGGIPGENDLVVVQQKDISVEVTDD